MDILNLTFAAILGALGTLLTGWLLYVLFSPFSSWFAISREAIKIKRATGRIGDADRAIAAGNLGAAIDALSGAVVFELLKSRELIARLRDHHQNILSRSIVIAEDTGGRVSNIEEVERLFLQRTELLTLFAKVNEAFERIAQKRETAGKSLPSWSKSDHQKRIADVKKELAANQAMLQKELKALFNAIKAPPSSAVTYH